MKKVTCFLLVLVVLVVLLCCAEGRGRGGGGRGRGTRFGGRRVVIYSGSSGGGGGGSLSRTAQIGLIILVVFVALIILFWVLYYQCRDETVDSAFPKTRRTATTTSEGDSATAFTPTPATFSNRTLVHSTVPYRIFGDAEMALYRHDQRLRREFEDCVEAKGSVTRAKPFFMRKKLLEVQHHLETRRELERFLAVYDQVLGSDNVCRGCGVFTSRTNVWYRCRKCVDVDLCSACYNRGPTIASSGHVPAHECARLTCTDVCSQCIAYLYNTKVECLECQEKPLCLGCYIDGKYRAHHGGHIEALQRVRPVSHVMEPPEAGRSGEAAPLLPPTANGPPFDAPARVSPNRSRGSSPSRAPYPTGGIPPYPTAPGGPPYPTGPTGPNSTGAAAYPVPGNDGPVQSDGRPPYPTGDAPPPYPTAPAPEAPPPSYSDVTGNTATT